MTFNRFAVGKTIAGAGLAGVLLVGLGAAPAEARPPSHAPAYGYRANHSSHDCDCERTRSRYSRSRYVGSHRDDCRHGSGYSSRYGSSRHDDSRYDDYRYGGSRYDNYRSSGSRYGNYSYGTRGGRSNRGPYGDLDRDGRRNYWDQDKDGDGRRNERDDRPKNPRRR